MKKLLLLFTAVLLASSVSWGQRNIVIIYADGIGWTDLGYVNSKIETPNINALKNDGIFYARAYAASPESSPNMAALLTGKYPLSYGMVRDIDEMDASGKEFQTSETCYDHFKTRAWFPLEEVTYAERLKDLGYYNCFIGKWHLGNGKYAPDQQGFDKVAGVSPISFPTSFYPPYFSKGEVFKDIEAEKYLTDELTDYAVKFIDGYKDSKPFQMTVSYYGYETAAMGRKDWVDKYVKKGFPAREAQHYAMVSAIDESVGRIRSAIEKNGKKDNTVVIFLSGRGNRLSNEPLRGDLSADKALYEGGIRVPMIIAAPDVKAKGGVCPSPVMVIDIYPTLVELVTGKRCKDKVDGMNLGSTFKGQDVNVRNLFVYRSYDIQCCAMLKGVWKFVMSHDGTMELYNIAKDLAEVHNLRTNYPDISDGMQEMCERWISITPLPEIVPSEKK